MSLASLPRVGHPKHAQSTCELETPIGSSAKYLSCSRSLISYLILSLISYIHSYILRSGSLGRGWFARAASFLDARPEEVACRDAVDRGAILCWAHS